MNALHLMDSANQLTPDLRRELMEVAQVAFNRLTGILSLDGVDAALYINPSWCLPETGIGGYAPTGQWLQLTLDPQNPNFAANWRRELPATLAHELHHVRRWRGPGYGQTLREALATEGLALHFEAQQRGEVPVYAQPMIDLDALWQHALPVLNTDTYNHPAWFFGLEAEGLPRWGGYMLAYERVRLGTQRLGGDAVSLADIPAFELVPD